MLFNDAGTQLCSAFTGCRRVTIGAHQACCSLLQALFMTANVLKTTSTSTTRTITKGLFMVMLGYSG
jgi:hypothetical protein